MLARRPAVFCQLRAARSLRPPRSLPARFAPLCILSLSLRGRSIRSCRWAAGRTPVSDLFGSLFSRLKGDSRALGGAPGGPLNRGRDAAASRRRAARGDHVTGGAHVAARAGGGGGGGGGAAGGRPPRAHLPPPTPAGPLNLNALCPSSQRVRLFYGYLRRTLRRPWHRGDIGQG